MTLLMKLSRRDDVGLQYQVFEQIRSMILDGTVKCGAKLPATRLLSETLGVSRNTISLAYARLADEGYIEMRESVGTFVSAQIPDLALLPAKAPNVSTHSLDDHFTILKGATIAAEVRSQTLINPHKRPLCADFWVGRPAAKSFPLKTWSKLIHRRLLSAGGALTEYKDAAGLPDLRKAIVEHLRTARGITAHEDQIIIVGGCQDGLNLVCRMMMTRGGSAIVETPCYQGAAYLFESFGARLHAVPVDAKGLVTSKLPDVANSIAYVTPSHQYPLGVTLALDRRIELLAWAARTNSYILEDDYDSDFRFSGPPITALKGLDRVGRVIYLGTFSKCIGAGIRVGYVVIPAGLEDSARHFKTLMNNGQPWLEQAALADFMKGGFYESHLRRIRRLYLNRRNALLDSLKRHFGSNEVLGAEAGMHLVWRIPEHLPFAREIETIALSVGVGVYTVSSGGAADLCPALENDGLLVLGFSSLSEQEIELGISRLAQALAKVNPLAITRSSARLPKGEIRPRSKDKHPQKQKRAPDRRMLA